METEIPTPPAPPADKPLWTCEMLEKLKQHGLATSFRAVEL